MAKPTHTHENNRPFGPPAATTRPQRHPLAFTLLEIAVVLAIMAVLVAAVSLSPTRWFRSSHVRDTVDQLVFVDHLARQHAARSGRPTTLEYDLKNATLARVEPNQAKRHTHRFRIPSHVTLDRVATAQKQSSFGRVTIPCSSQGHTPTYALRIAGPDHEKQWWVVSGLTGQTTRVTHGKNVDQLLQQLAP